MKLKYKLLFLVLALQAAWILGTTFFQESLLRNGKLVLLETRPVDPRDLLRGDYLILNYKISDVPLRLFTPGTTNAPPGGETIYVLLEPKGPFHEVVQASTKPLMPNTSQVLLKGRSTKWWNLRSWDGSSSVHVEYGLERYYVRENTGNPRGQITVQAAVSASGQALIRRVFIDGKPYADAIKAP